MTPKAVEPVQELVFKSQGGWLENAGIVGLIRILNDDDYRIADNCLYLKQEALNHFTDKYFEFFITAYGKQTHLEKIISFKSTLQELLSKDDAEIDVDKTYNQLENWFKNSLKYYVATGSFKKISSIIESDLDIKAAIKDCSKDLKQLNKLKKNQSNKSEVISALRQLITKLQQFTDYFSETRAKNLFMAKTLSYIVIKNAWNKISFLNPQTKIINLYEDYKKTFVEPVIEYLKNDHKWDVYQCFTCGRPMKEQKYSYSFLNGLGYDVNRKNSNAWIFNNDQFMCPICRFMYTAVSAGFNYNMSSQGIFVNQNQNLLALAKANNAILRKMRLDATNERVTPWRAFALSFQQEFTSSSRFTLANIQVVSYQNGQYRFALIPKKIANVLRQANERKVQLQNGEVKSLLAILSNTYIQSFRGQDSLQIYDAMLQRLLVSANLNTLINNILQMKIVDNANANITVNQVMNLIEINLLYFKEMSNLSLTKEELSHMRGSGKILREGYDNANKAQTLAYRLLQALKIQNNDQFMNILLDAYLYQKKLVPKNFIQAMNSQEEFNQLGYAFIAGLIPNNSTEGGKVNEK